MQLKVLQSLLGHAGIQTTMDRYVHVTDKTLEMAVKQFEEYHSQKTLKIREKQRRYKDI